MSIWIVWLAPVAMLLMLSAQPLMRTLSVALGVVPWLLADAASPATSRHPRIVRTPAIVIVRSLLLSVVADVATALL